MKINLSQNLSFLRKKIARKASHPKIATNGLDSKIFVWKQNRSRDFWSAENQTGDTLHWLWVKRSLKKSLNKIYYFVARKTPNPNPGQKLHKGRSSTPSSPLRSCVYLSNSLHGRRDTFMKQGRGGEKWASVENSVERWSKNIGAIEWGTKFAQIKGLFLIIIWVKNILCQRKRSTVYEKCAQTKNRLAGFKVQSSLWLTPVTWSGKIRVILRLHI